LFKFYLVCHDGPEAARNGDSRDAVVHELDSLALMRPEDFGQHRIDDDVNRTFRWIERQFVVLGQFGRFVEDERVFFERVVKRLSGA
jgi:hypothetical protein